MAKPWSEVSGSPDFQAMAPDQQEAARQQYFDQVVAPQVPPDKLSDVRAQFDTQTATPPSGSQQSAEPSMLDGMKQFAGDAARGIGLGIRDTIQGVGALPIAATDAAGRLIVGENYQPVSQSLTDAGLPVAESGAEKLISAAGQGGMSALGGAGLGTALAGAASPVVAGAGSLLAASPGIQAISGGAAGLGGEAAGQMGAGPGGQAAASIGAGLLGGGIASALSPSVSPSAQAASRGIATNDAFGSAPVVPAAGTTAANTPIQAASQSMRLPPASAGDLSQSGRTAEYRQSVRMLDKADIPLDAGQRSGTNWLRTASRTLSEVPFSGKPLQNMFEKQQQAYQKALLKMAGNTQGDKMITRRTLENTADDLSREYSSALGNKSVNIADDDFLDQLGAIEAKHTQFVDDPSKNKVKQIVSSFLDQSLKTNQVTGEWYQAQRSLFANRAKKQSEVADLYGDLKMLLDDAFKRSAGDAKGDLDSKYARYKQLQSIYERNGGGAASEGFISPVAVSREAAGAPGGKDWQDFTRAAATVLTDRVGNSGTAQRNFILGLAGGSVPAFMIEPTTAAVTAAGMTGARGISSLLARQPGGQPLLQSLAPVASGISNQQLLQ